MNHPPRLKKIRLPAVFGDTRHYRDLRAFYVSHPDVRADDRRTNRALLAKGAAQALARHDPAWSPYRSLVTRSSEGATPTAASRRRTSTSVSPPAPRSSTAFCSRSMTLSDGPFKRPS